MHEINVETRSVGHSFLSFLKSTSKIYTQESMALKKNFIAAADAVAIGDKKKDSSSFDISITTSTFNQEHLVTRTMTKGGNSHLVESLNHHEKKRFMKVVMSYVSSNQKVSPPTKVTTLPHAISDDVTHSVSDAYLMRDQSRKGLIICTEVKVIWAEIGWGRSLILG